MDIHNIETVYKTRPFLASFDQISALIEREGLCGDDLEALLTGEAFFVHNGKGRVGETKDITAEQLQRLASSTLVNSRDIAAFIAGKMFQPGAKVRVDEIIVGESAKTISVSAQVERLIKAGYAEFLGMSADEYHALWPETVAVPEAYQCNVAGALLVDRSISTSIIARGLINPYRLGKESMAQLFSTPIARRYILILLDQDSESVKEGLDFNVMPGERLLIFMEGVHLIHQSTDRKALVLGGSSVRTQVQTGNRFVPVLSPDQDSWRIGAFKATSTFGADTRNLKCVVKPAYLEEYPGSTTMTGIKSVVHIYR